MHPSEETDRTARIFYVFEIREFECCHIWCLLDNSKKIDFSDFRPAGDFERGGDFKPERRGLWGWRLGGEDFLRISRNFKEF